MMGERTVMQEALFYSFRIEEHVPGDHLLRSIDRFVDLSGIREHLKPFYSAMGRPSIDPELMIRMLIVGYCMGIRSERRLCEALLSGKPLLSWPAYVPVTFELGIICTAIGTLGGMCLLNRLPAFYHWLFHSKRFESATDDGFFISIESTDSKWDSAGTSAFLESLGASHVELVEG